MEQQGGGSEGGLAVLLRGSGDVLRGGGLLWRQQPATEAQRWWPGG
jgi:hypothetical protein